uniref:Claspin n=1 Tax=Ditylenchus dipsaci TaxID=166011 RepID=A0A915EGP9_9BILA
MEVGNVENCQLATPTVKNEHSTPTTGSKKRSAISRKLQALIDSGQLVLEKPVLGSPSSNAGENILLDDGGTPTSCTTETGSRKRKNNEIDDWFQSKLAIRSASSSQLTTPAGTPKTIKYQQVKKMVEERLAIQRREDMQRRHGFYNADNEIFSTRDEEEEEAELTDEEELQEEEEEQEPEEEEEEEVQDSKASILKAHIKCMAEDEEDPATGEPETENHSSDAEDFHSSSEFEQEGEQEMGHLRRSIKKQCDSPTESVGSLGGSKQRAPKVIESDEEGDPEESGMDAGSGRSTPAIHSMNGVPCSQINDQDSSGSFARVPSWKAPPPTRRAKQEPELGFANENLEMFPVSELNAPPRQVAEDFKEALFLCSGTFDSSEAPHNPSSEPAMSSLALTQSDLFTAEDDDEDDFLPPAPQSKIQRIKTEILESYAESSSNSLHPLHRRHIKGEQEDEEDMESVVGKRRVKIADMFEDEASLSGDDVGSDAEEGGSELDEYEAEEGDMDELPDAEDMRDNLVKQYIKQKNDEEERRMLKLQEHFFSDSDLHGQKDMDRSFRFRMRNDMDVNWKNDEEESVEMTQLMERKVEMNKWRLEQKKERSNVASSSSIHEGFATSHTSLIKIGQHIVMKQQNVTETIIVSDQTPCNSAGDNLFLPPPSPFSSVRKGDSLLKNPCLLGSLLKDGSAGTPTTRTVFTTPKSRRS